MSRSRRGLSLIEVMIALAILGTGIVALITVAANGLAVVRRARYYETARHLLSRAEAENPLQIEEEIEEGVESGDFKGGPAGYKWSREVSLVNEDDDEEEVYRLVTSIRGNSLENRISIESPLGKAIEGHHVGDQVEVKVNDKSSYVVEIRKIEKTGEEDSDRIRSY